MVQAEMFKRPSEMEIWSSSGREYLYINESSDVEAEVTEEILPLELKENNKGLRPETLGTPTSRKPRKRGDSKRIWDKVIRNM